MKGKGVVGVVVVVVGGSQFVSVELDAARFHALGQAAVHSRKRS